MRAIRVSAAVIIDGNRVLAAERGYGEYRGYWEFPGGKRESGETGVDAIVREIREELRVDIVPEELVTTVEYDYPTFHITMHCFLASIRSGEVHLLEHEAARWLAPEELDEVSWLPADIAAVEKLKMLLARQNVA